jgi:thiol:disulfide interchange protein DsbD
MNRLLLCSALLMPGLLLAGSPWSAQQAVLLPADQAFIVEPALWQDGRLQVPIRVAPGHYLYRHRFELLPASAPLALPPGEPYADEFFGEVEIYRADVQLEMPAAVAPDRITLRYQGCSELGVCYPPQTRTLPVDVLP